MFDAYKTRFWDEFLTHFVSEAGIARRMARQERKVERALEVETSGLKLYLAALQLQNAGRLAHVLEKQYFKSVEDQEKGILELLNYDIKEAIKFYRDLHKLIVDVQDADRYPMNEGTRRTITDDLIASLKLIEGFLNSMLGSLAGKDSAQVSAFKALDLSSQLRTIQGETITLRKDARKERAIEKSADAEVRSVQKSEDDKKIEQDFENIKAGMAKLTEELQTMVNQEVMVLTEIHGAFSIFCTKKVPRIPLTLLNPDSASAKNIEKMPGLAVLRAPFPQGYGYPEHEFARLDEVVARIREHYQNAVNTLIAVDRLEESAIEHEMPKAA